MLCQLSYWPSSVGVKSRSPLRKTLFRFAVHGVFLAPWAIFTELETIWIVSAIFFCRVISLFAVTALQGNDWANILLLGSHAYLPTFSYSIILVTTPAPTVRPPSRMANL